MTWKHILKNTAGSGPEDMGGIFTIDMFKNSNWVNALEQLLSLSIKDAEMGEIQSFKKVTDDAINYGLEYYVDLFNTLMQFTDYGEDVLDTSKDYAESTRRFAGETEISEPKPGDKGRGMNPKRLEYLTDSISKSVESNVTKLIRDIQNKIDRFHAKGGELQESDEKVDLSAGLTEEMLNRTWDQLTAGNYVDKLLLEGTDDIAEAFTESGFKVSTVDMKTVANQMKDKKSTKMFLTHVSIILESKIIQGMGARSPEEIDRKLKDLLTEEEIKWFKDNAVRVSESLGPLGSIDETVYPEVDRFGIPKIRQVNPETGEEYFIPRDIGEISDPDFDPAEESEDRPAPEVQEYDPESGRMRTPAEWRQFQDKFASEDSNDITWFSILKEE